jgi:hypothetical protein
MDKALELEQRLARADRYYHLEVWVRLCHDAAEQLALYRKEIARLKGESDA